jgi:hypothetical protein
VPILRKSKRSARVNAQLLVVLNNKQKRMLMVKTTKKRSPKRRSLKRKKMRMKRMLLLAFLKKNIKLTKSTNSEKRGLKCIMKNKIY